MTARELANSPALPSAAKPTSTLTESQVLMIHLCIGIREDRIYDRLNAAEYAKDVKMVAHFEAELEKLLETKSAFENAFLALEEPEP